MNGPRVRLTCDGQRYHIRWFCADSADWRQILDDFKYEFEPWERRFEPGTRAWSVPLYCGARVRQWADRWFDAADREYREDEAAGGTYGRHSYSHNQSGYGRHGPSGSRTTPLESAYAELHLLPTAPPELAQVAHKIMVKLVHPDAGGSHEAAVAVNLAWEVISADQQRRSA